MNKYKKTTKKNKNEIKKEIKRIKNKVVDMEYRQRSNICIIKVSKEEKHGNRIFKTIIQDSLTKIKRPEYKYWKDPPDT